MIRAWAGESRAFTLAAQRTSFESSTLPRFGDAGTLAAMSGVSPVRASLPLSFAQPRSTSSLRESVRLAGVFLPAPQPHLACHAPSHQHRPPHAAARSAAVTSERRFAATRPRWRKFERTPNHALQRTGMAVTARAPSHLRPPPPSPAHGPRQPCPSLSLGSLGAFAHLSRAMSVSEDIPSLMPPIKLHGLTSNSELVPSSVGLAFGSFESFEQPTFSEFCIRESLASSTASLLGVHREAHTSRRSTRSSSERLDRAVVFGFLPLHAPGESELSRHSHLGIHREFERCSRNSFTTSIPNRTAPNHALQRTAPRVTVAAILAWTRPVRAWHCPTSVASFCAPPSQLPRHAPPSLSLGR